MPRLQRQESPTGYYHVMTRGINKEKIFISKSDKKKIIKVIKEKSSEIDCKIIAYCIMDNHLHLLVDSEIEELSLLMKKINISYAIYYNFKKERVGPVFQDRYKSEIIYDDRHLWGVIRYIHNNPVKGKIVSSPEDYIWSSMMEYISKDNNIIHYDVIEYIKENFKDNNKLKEFHKQIDKNEYLEVKEDKLIGKEELRNSIISNYLEKMGVESVNDLVDKEQLIKNLLETQLFSYREISKSIGVSLYGVYNSNKKNRPQCLN